MVEVVVVVGVVVIVLIAVVTLMHPMKHGNLETLISTTTWDSAEFT